MSGYLTGYMYGKLINATHLGLITGPWLQDDEQISLITGFASSRDLDRPSWV